MLFRYFAGQIAVNQAGAPAMPAGRGDMAYAVCDMAKAGPSHVFATGRPDAGRILRGLKAENRGAILHFDDLSL
ncbi:MAG: hypothetical protein ACRC02_12320 [Vogesella sp.]